eukprot:243362_1
MLSLHLVLILLLNIGICFKPDETVCIMTRDNVCLSTFIYYATTGSRPWSCVYRQTPYGKETLDPTIWTDSGFCFIAQDFRGMGSSNGTYSTWRTNGNDTIDTIEWLLQPQQTKFSNGLIGVNGVSADAVAEYVAMSGITNDGEANFNRNNELINHIKVGYLIIATPLFRSMAYQNGAFRAALIEGYFDQDIDEPQSTVEIIQNEAFTSWWYPLSGGWTGWDTRNHPNQTEQSLFNYSIVHEAGWYDIFSTLQIVSAIEINETGQVGARGNQILIVEPTGHCGGGAIRWPNDTYGDQLMTNTLAPQIFKGAFEAAQKNEIFNIHNYVPWNVLFYMLSSGERDTNGLFWVAAESFPETFPVYGYLNGDSLDTDIPDKTGSVSYMFDPTNPVITYGGNNLEISPCGPQSQEKNEKGRKDILHFTSDPLTKEFAIVGMITVKLFISSDVVDTDFTAKIIDIYPNGVPMLVQDGIQRMRWRNGPYEANKAPHMKTDEIYEVDIMIGMMSYIWNVKHSISVSISSSNFPRFSVNWNNGLDVIDGNTDYKIANNTIHFGGKYASQLILPVVDLQWLKDHEA